MALMFPRLAQNFAKNGYFPTDEVTIERTLSALQPAPSGKIRIIDPCAGEGVALAECAYALDRKRIEAFAVEYDYERAEHARTLADRTLRSDLMDTVITRQAFGLLWLNPPYGDLPRTLEGNSYQGNGRKRLEKLFYQKSIPLLQYGGILAFIIPNYTLDDELSGWIANHFTDVRVFAAPEQQFKQVVIFGVKTKRNDRSSPAEAKETKNRLLACGQDIKAVEELPEEYPFEPYFVPAAQRELEHFYRISLDPEQFALEIARLGGLWPDFQMHFGRTGRVARQPARALSPWHLALSLAAGAISGPVTSADGHTLIVKGNTHKEKTKKVEYSEDDNGNITETRTLVDRFVPMIKAWDMTPTSKTFGMVMTITSGAPEEKVPQEVDSQFDNLPDAPPNGGYMLFPSGTMVMTAGVGNYVNSGQLDIEPYLKKHFSGDWGDIDDSDKKQNDQALKNKDGRLFSSYDLEGSFKGTFGMESSKLWIITEWDRSVTTVLFPSEY